MNLPNKLTLFRILMVPVIMVLLIVPLPISETAMRIATAAVFFVTAVTDFIDGRLARRYNQVTDFGKFLDPLADKFLIIASLLGILYRFDALRPYFVWATAIVIFREFAVTSVRMIAANKAGLVIAASWLGKFKTLSQMVCVLVTLLEPLLVPTDFFIAHTPLTLIFLVIMSIMTIWSGTDYMIKYWPYIGKTK